MDQNLNKAKAVVLMSGGMDSCVTAAIASQMRGANSTKVGGPADTCVPYRTRPTLPGGG